MALFVASSGEAPDGKRAEWALQRAEAVRFDLAVTLCGDVGRRAEYRRLSEWQQQLEKQFHISFGRRAIDELVIDDRGDCENSGGYRRQVSAYDNALADAQDALGAK